MTTPGPTGRVTENVTSSDRRIQLLGVSRRTVVRLINDDVLPAERIDNRHRLLLDDVLSYREQQKTGDGAGPRLEALPYRQRFAGEFELVLPRWRAFVGGV